MFENSLQRKWTQTISRLSVEDLQTSLVNVTSRGKQSERLENKQNVSLRLHDNIACVINKSVKMKTQSDSGSQRNWRERRSGIGDVTPNGIPSVSSLLLRHSAWVSCFRHSSNRHYHQQLQHSHQLLRILRCRQVVVQLAIWAITDVATREDMVDTISHVSHRVKGNGRRPTCKGQVASRALSLSRIAPVFTLLQLFQCWDRYQ